MAELTRFILGGINSRQEFWPIKYSLGILWSRIFRKSVGSKNMVLKDNMFCRKTDNHKRNLLVINRRRYHLYLYALGRTPSN